MNICVTNVLIPLLFRNYSLIIFKGWLYSFKCSCNLSLLGIVISESTQAHPVMTRNAQGKGKFEDGEVNDGGLLSQSVIEKIESNAANSLSRKVGRYGLLNGESLGQLVKDKSGTG